MATAAGDKLNMKHIHKNTNCNMFHKREIHTREVKYMASISLFQSVFENATSSVQCRHVRCTAQEALLQCLGDEELQVSVSQVSQVSQVQFCHKAHVVIR